MPFSRQRAGNPAPPTRALAWLRRLAGTLALAGVAGCAGPAPGRAAPAVQVPAVEGPASDTGGDAHERLLDPATVIQDGWRHLPLRGVTDYRIVAVDEQLAVSATGAGGASILIREVAPERAGCTAIEWEWRVDRVQPSADLTARSAEDVAASVYVVFGDPGMIEMPDPTPTLRYVWTSARMEAGAVIDSPYLPGVVRSIVVRRGDARLGEWLVERRRLDEDYEAAFGEPLGESIYAVALFTDNDQTREPVLAYYRRVALRCAG